MYLNYYYSTGENHIIKINFFYRHAHDDKNIVYNIYGMQLKLLLWRWASTPQTSKDGFFFLQNSLQ